MTRVTIKSYTVDPFNGLVLMLSWCYDICEGIGSAPACDRGTSLKSHNKG